MDKSMAELLINGIDLEGEIKAEGPKAASVRERPPANSAPVTAGVPRLAMPEYVQHEEGLQKLANCRPKPLSQNTKLRPKKSRRWARS
jgi:hypothetical protein